MDFKKSMRVVVVNARGSEGKYVENGQLYSGGYTGDLEQAIEHISKKFPTSSLYAVGFSNGANLLLKYVGEQEKFCLLSGAISISPQFDPFMSVAMLESTFLRRLISVAIRKEVVRLVRANLVNDKTNLEQAKMDALLDSVKSIRDFHQKIMAPMFGFESAIDYEHDGNTPSLFKKINIPTLVIACIDDPVQSSLAIPYEDALVVENVILTTLSGGGHSLLLYKGWFAKTLMWYSSWQAKKCLAIDLVDSFIKSIRLSNDEVLTRTSSHVNMTGTTDYSEISMPPLRL